MDLLETKFVAALNTLDQAKPFAKSLYQTDVFQLANELACMENGITILDKYAHLFDNAGVFLGGDWEDPTKLQPPFVGNSLRLRGIYSIIEMLSEMRMLAIAKGTYKHAQITKEEANAFLNEVVALNLDLLSNKLPEDSSFLEEHIVRAQYLFNFLVQELSFKEVAEQMIKEIDRLTVQRPIITRRIVELIELSEQLLNSTLDQETFDALEKYCRAIDTPTPLSKNFSNAREYRLKLEEATEQELIAEAKLFAQSMIDTGLVSPYHVVLLRFLNRKDSEIIPVALGLAEAGISSFNDHKKLIHDIIQIAIYPQTKQAVYGLSNMLNRGVLKIDSLVPAFGQLFELPIHAEVQKQLSAFATDQSGISMNGLLIAGVVSVLGQPLGIGQGQNPTCQSARAISLWAQFEPNLLMAYIASAARDYNIEMTFEGEPIHSNLLTEGIAGDIQQDLDTISILLVPHLDKIYNAMIKRTLLRGEDGHKWVNREFYGEWIPSGFMNAIDQLTLKVKNYSAFVKLFYATHHPMYNEGSKLIYPNPVGIFLTNIHGELLGLHAVSIQRIENDQHGDCRVYFYNPNNDSTQNWGQGIKVSVAGFGELEGESSLPFHEFVARMYAYHYNPYEQGDTYMVEERLVKNVEELAKDSWGKTYIWE
ncbi:hypothetical protein D1B33_11060 [Lysinibacillus yapensis]|uniref:Uncharacterized protein n=1 Tax=Ureibacillus yapensis TaxID=2304605 RepID=A0A396S7M4_9BACL|nr:hypothetical protein D1B33_11060 [Lysinibacillus yapensis]